MHKHNCFRRCCNSTQAYCRIFSIFGAKSGCLFISLHTFPYSSMQTKCAQPRSNSHTASLSTMFMTAEHFFPLVYAWVTFMLWKPGYALKRRNLLFHCYTWYRQICVLITMGKCILSPVKIRDENNPVGRYLFGKGGRTWNTLGVIAVTSTGCPKSRVLHTSGNILEF